MYFGSVRFFKHLIITVIVLVIIALSYLFFNVLTVTVAVDGNVEGNHLFPMHTADNLISDLTYGKVFLSDNSEYNYLATITDPKNKPYQLLYPDLYSSKPEQTTKTRGTVYLTFDDGPSQHTGEILDILKENDIKATFFLIGKTDEHSQEMMRRIVAEGHTIAIHTYTHKYDQIYSSIEAYLQDFDRIYELIYDTTGVKPDIFRFPGGSVNGHNEDIYKDLIEEMDRRGFTYYDWNVSAEDASANATSRSVSNSVINGVLRNSRAIVLLHDFESRTATLSALEGIIKDLKDYGYEFDRLTNQIEPINFY